VPLKPLAYGADGSRFQSLRSRPSLGQGGFAHAPVTEGNTIRDEVSSCHGSFAVDVFSIGGQGGVTGPGSDSSPTVPSVRFQSTRAS
jgi:hypothetical protein